LDTLIKPHCSIPGEVVKIHGIPDAMVADARGYSDIHNQLMDIFMEKSVIIYNASFDLRLIRQSGPDLDFTNIEASRSIICAMEWYAEFHGQWDNIRNSFKWQKLVNAARQQNIDVSDLRAHRALADCIITQRVITTVNGKI